MNHLAVIGDPIHHSLSPVMHNAALEDSKLNDSYDYKAIHVKPNLLSKFIETLDQNQISGFNVTQPYKMSIIKYLDELDKMTKNIGAANTVIKKNTKLIGYNTDIQGFIDSLDDNNIKYKNRRALVLGAGGAAQAILYGLLNAGTGVEIFNRTQTKAVNLKKRFDEFGSITVQDKLKTNDIDIIINTTSVGLNNMDSPLPSALISEQHEVVDIIYNPFTTPLLREAQKKNCHYINGLDMLVSQGALAFNFFTGIEPNKLIMKEALLSHFKNRPNNEEFIR